MRFLQKVNILAIQTMFIFTYSNSVYMWQLYICHYMTHTAYYLTDRYYFENMMIRILTSAKTNVI